MTNLFGAHNSRTIRAQFGCGFGPMRGQIRNESAQNTFYILVIDVIQPISFVINRYRYVVDKNLEMENVRFQPESAVDAHNVEPRS